MPSARVRSNSTWRPEESRSETNRSFIPTPDFIGLTESVNASPAGSTISLLSPQNAGR